MKRTILGGLIGFGTLEVACAASLPLFAGRSLAFATLCYGAECAIALYLVVRLWTRDDGKAILFIVLTAVAVRVPMLASPPARSNDAYRYVWDGELLVRGIDPHAVTPLSASAGPLRSTWLWKHIDYRALPTVYPPVALALFALMALDSNDLWGVKAVAFAGDAAVIGSLFVMLGLLRVPRGRAALYALHPLATLEFSGNGHIEGWAIAGIVVAAASPVTGTVSRIRPIALAAAILTKIYPAMLAPIIFARNRLSFAAALAIVAVAYVPELLRGHALGSATNYLAAQRFNGSAGALLGTGGELVIVATVGFLAYRTVRRGGEIAVAVLATILAYLVSSPNVLPLMCINNPPDGGLMSNAVWRGVRLRDLLGEAGPSREAKRIAFHAADNYIETIPYAKAIEPTTIIAFEMNGEPLPVRHGFPVRAIVPGLFGEKNIKWLTEITVETTERKGFYERQGWGPHYEIPTHARFDAPDFSKPLAAGSIELRGIGFCGNRGVSRVEITFDGGRSWHPAHFTTPYHLLTWRLWRYIWKPASPGTYQLAVRATDGHGNVQTSNVHGAETEGATGLDRVTAHVV